MKAAKALILKLFSELCFLSTCSPHKYFLVEKSRTWQEAQDYCRAVYSDLATVENQEEMDQLVKVVHAYYTGHVWIGLYHKITNWKWSLQREGYYGEGEEDFRTWAAGEPTDGTLGHENCVAMGTDGLWFDVPCTWTYNFVCITGSPASPTYISEDRLVTWSEAQSYCREKYNDLASVRNLDESETIRATMFPTTWAWIGLYRDPWKWSDGTPLSFTRWNGATGEPNAGIHGPCVLTHRDSWEDDSCHRALFFVCQTVSKMQSVVKVKLTMKETTKNLQNVADVLLKQMYQKMELTQVVKLWWRKQPDGEIFHSERKTAKPDNTCVPI